MLKFFRRYQKIVFVFVTVVIVISFVFFGTFSTIVGQNEMPNTVIGLTRDGSKIYERDVHTLLTFLQTNSSKEGTSALQEQVFDTQLALHLAEDHFEEIKGDAEGAYRRLRNYTPYTHPQASFISATGVWERFAPEINELLSQIRQSSVELGKQELGLMLKLYAAQERLPAHLLKQFLYYQQSQVNWVHPDPALSQADLSLAGLHNPEEWFGVKFWQLVTQFVVSSGIRAEKEGFAVSKEEAKHYLVNSSERLMAQYGSQDRGRESVNQMLRALGVEESRALFLCQKWLAFQQMLRQTATSVLVDPVSVKGYYGVADSEVKVRSFSLPKTLQFADFRSCLKFERYVDAVTQGSKDLDLPSQLLSIEQVEERFPQLIQKQFEVEMASVTKEQAASRLSIKEMLEWQLDGKHFARLSSEFPVLSSKPSTSREERYVALQSLDQPLRMKLDSWTRLSLLDENPHWIDEALNKVPMEKRAFGVRLKGGHLPFEGMASGEKVLEALAKDAEKLTFDGIHFYRVKVLRSEEKELVSLETAFTDGTLDLMLDDFLRASYPYLSKRSELKRSDGSVAPFEEIKDQIGALLYADRVGLVKKAIKKDDLALDQVAQHRFDLYLNKWRQQLIQGAEIKEETPWALKAGEEIWKRGEGHFDEAVSMNTEEWSELYPDGFFEVLEKHEGAPSNEKMEAIQALIGRKAQESLIRQLLNEATL